MNNMTNTIEIKNQDLNEAWKEVLAQYNCEMKVVDKDAFVKAIIHEAQTNPLPGSPSPLALFLSSCIVRVIENGDPSVKRPTFGNTFDQKWDKF